MCLVFVLEFLFQFLVFLFVASVVTRKPIKITMARNLGSFAAPSNSFMCEPIAQPNVAAAEYEIKPNLVSMVQQGQFGGSASEDVGIHLHNFSKLCNMTRIRDYEPDALKLHLFPFSLRGKAKECLLALPRGSITSWTECCSKFLSKFCPPAKIMQLRSQITSLSRKIMSH